jgi:hypothetical protein
MRLAYPDSPPRQKFFGAAELVPTLPAALDSRGLDACFVVTDSAGQEVPEPSFGDPMVYLHRLRTKNPRCSLKPTDAKRPYSTRENATMRAFVLGAAALTLSAGAASARAVYPTHGYAPYGYGYTATAPLYDYAGPASSAPVHTAPHGYGPLVYAPQLYAPTPAFPAAITQRSQS